MRQRVGSLGEQIAAEHLRAKGYRVLERNVRLAQGEIDIVAQDGDVLAFVEVRTKRGSQMGPLEESIPERKKQKLRQLVDLYLQTRQINGAQIRIDAVLIDMGPDGSPRRIELIKDAIGG